MAPKTAVVALITAVATALNLPTEDVAGRTLFGGHSLRVTGAQHLAAHGFPLLLIQLLARWSSEVILRYVAEAPLIQVTAEYRRRHQGLSLESFLAADPVELGSLSLRLDDLDGRTAGLLAAERTMRAELSRLAERVPPSPSQTQRAIFNPGFAWHKEPAWQTRTSPPATWRTLCGWAYGIQPHVRAASPAPSGKLCRRCYPEARAGVAAGRGGAVEDSADSESQ